MHKFQQNAASFCVFPDVKICKKPTEIGRVCDAEHYFKSRVCNIERYKNTVGVASATEKWGYREWDIEIHKATSKSE
jgi:hypothetical protein